MIKSRVEATSVMASHQLTFSRVSDYNKTPTTKNPEKKQGGARVKGALEFEQRIRGVFFSLRKHFLHVGPQVLDRILSPLPTVQILPDLIIDQSGCFGLIMDGLGQEIIKMAPHFVKKPTFFRTWRHLLYTTDPTNPVSCVACNMCASARNVNILPTPTQHLA